MDDYVYSRSCWKEVHETVGSYLNYGAIISIISSKNRIATALLAFFWVTLAFILSGKIGQGVLHLLFRWTLSLTPEATILLSANIGTPARKKRNGKGKTYAAAAVVHDSI